MRNLSVYLEINGKFCHVGNIIGNSSADACFQYSKAYLESADSHPISISLPLSGEIFSPERTKNFFEGLLPEGFSRRAVADWIKAEGNDYLSILAVLGRECIGAIKIAEKGDGEEEDGYEFLSMDKVKENIHMRNKNASIYPICAKDGRGIEELANHLRKEIEEWRK